MNWKLILQLSMFGLAMGLATVFFIPPNIEPVCWLAIMLLCAYVIARQCPSARFQHGLLLGLANCVWVTGSHVLFFSQYIAGHTQEAERMASMALPTHPRVMMLIVGPVIGVISGIVIGLLALAAGKFVKSEPKPTARGAAGF